MFYRGVRERENEGERERERERVRERERELEAIVVILTLSIMRITTSMPRIVSLIAMIRTIVINEIINTENLR